MGLLVSMESAKSVESTFAQDAQLIKVNVKCVLATPFLKILLTVLKAVNA